MMLNCLVAYLQTKSSLDAERHRSVKLSTQSPIIMLFVADGQRLYPCMHGHLRLGKTREREILWLSYRACLALELVVK